MFETQTAVSRWITEQKKVSDSVMLEAQRMLMTDKGASLRSIARFYTRDSPPPTDDRPRVPVAENIQHHEEELDGYAAKGEALQQGECGGCHSCRGARPSRAQQ
jgi:mono/diheme cytochrome c family protein